MSPKIYAYYLLQVLYASHLWGHIGFSKHCENEQNLKANNFDLFYYNLKGLFIQVTFTHHNQCRGFPSNSPLWKSDSTFCLADPSIRPCLQRDWVQRGNRLQRDTFPLTKMKVYFLIKKPDVRGTNAGMRKIVLTNCTQQRAKWKKKEGMAVLKNGIGLST